jgi:hypothetical protein
MDDSFDMELQEEIEEEENLAVMEDMDNVVNVDEDDAPHEGANYRLTYPKHNKGEIN